MNFCSHCGSADLVRTVPLGDIGVRYTCRSCQRIHYQRHSIVAGCLAVWQGRVLLCRRAIEPFRGRWTLPAGYLEVGETLDEAAARELYEEANARVGDQQLFAIYNLPMFSEIYVLFTGGLVDPSAAPGDESLETNLFGREEIPWDSLAFPMVREALRSWTAVPDLAGPRVQMGDFFWGPEGAVRVRRPKFP